MADVAATCIAAIAKMIVLFNSLSAQASDDACKASSTRSHRSAQSNRLMARAI